MHGRLAHKTALKLMHLRQNIGFLHKDPNLVGAVKGEDKP